MNVVVVRIYILHFFLFYFQGTFVPRDKTLRKMQANHEKELTSYKQTICHLEEKSEQMLEEINNLKEALDLHRTGIDLHVEASGVWTDLGTKFY